jgi:hypothetical protein
VRQPPRGHRRAARHRVASRVARPDPAMDAVHFLQGRVRARSAPVEFGGHRRRGPPPEHHRYGGGGVPLYARVSKKHELNVFCGACGKAIAGLLERPDGRGGWERIILLPEGWMRRQDGVWQLSGHARRQLKRGYPIADARRPRSFFDQPTRPGSDGTSISWRYGKLLTELPVDIVCSYPRCGFRQTLDPIRLDVVPARPDDGAWLVKSLFPGAVPRRYGGTNPRYAGGPRIARWIFAELHEQWRRRPDG